MERLTQEKTRVIIGDFAKAISTRKVPCRKPQKYVINFRDEVNRGFERDGWLVPIELLRFRKDNGRIASDVMNYEKFNGILDEKSPKAQETIKDFLLKKDVEKTEELMQSILHTDQKEPAIITCDGFLINGNRRLMVLNELFKKLRDAKFEWMKVVILPNNGEPGGPPTIKEIEQIENRYQLQTDGKAEYTAFDQALSIRRKMAAGISLEDQLKDDPTTAGLGKKDFEQKVKEYQKKYLDPLRCADEYLKHFNREGLYSTISANVGDPEGRWQAFVDYSSRMDKILSDPEGRRDYSVNDHEIGKIKDLAFKIIRKRSFEGTGLPKLHAIMRELPKLVKNSDSKKELFKIVEIDSQLTEAEKLGPKGKLLDERALDLVWGNKHAEHIFRQVKRASQIHEQKSEQEKPVDLLEAALGKLNHKEMDVTGIPVSQFDEAMKLAKDIQERANEIEAEIYHYQKELKQLKKKGAK
jgi:hypothetical protein